MRSISRGFIGVLAFAFALGMGIFAYPIATLFLYSVQNVGASAFASSSFAGLANYRYIFADPLFATAIVNNLKLFLCVPVMVVLSVILSAILYDRPRGWRVYRTLLFIPYVLSIPVVGVVFGYIFEYRGVLNTAIRAVGLDILARDWLGSPAWAMPTIMRGQIRSGIANPSSREYNAEDGRRAFLSGEAAFSFNWQYVYALSKNPDESKVVGQVGIAPVPAGPGGPAGTSVNGSMALSLTTTSKHPDEACSAATPKDSRTSDSG